MQATAIINRCREAFQILELKAYVTFKVGSDIAILWRALSMKHGMIKNYCNRISRTKLAPPYNGCQFVNKLETLIPYVPSSSLLQ